MTSSDGRASFTRMIDKFLRQRAAEAFSPAGTPTTSGISPSLIASCELPPRSGGRPDWSEIAQRCAIAVETLERAGGILRPGINAITRFVGTRATKCKQSRKHVVRRDQKANPRPRRHRSAAGEGKSKASAAPEAHDGRAPRPTVSAPYPAGAEPHRTGNPVPGCRTAPVRHPCGHPRNSAARRTWVGLVLRMRKSQAAWRDRDMLRPKP